MFFCVLKRSRYVSVDCLISSSAIEPISPGQAPKLGHSIDFLDHEMAQAQAAFAINAAATLPGRWACRPALSGNAPKILNVDRPRRILGDPCSRALSAPPNHLRRKAPF